MSTALLPQHFLGKRVVAWRAQANPDFSDDSTMSSQPPILHCVTSVNHVIMARSTTKMGDVFSVKLDESRKKYFQYVANDLTQLNSDVIRVFKKTYSIKNARADLSEIVTGEVEFYAHCLTKWGIKLGFWERVGNVPNVGKVEVVFRDVKTIESRGKSVAKLVDMKPAQKTIYQIDTRIECRANVVGIKLQA